MTTRRIQASGPDLEQALSSAIAEVLGHEPDEVEFKLSAPGLSEVEGRLVLELEVGVSPEEGEDGEEGEDADRAAFDEADDQGGSPDGDAEPSDVTHGVAEEAVEGESSPARGEEGDEPVTAGDELSPEDLDEEGEAGADFLEGLLDSMDLPGDLRLRIHEDHVEIEVVEIGSGALIGRRGQTLEAIQELLRCSLQRQFQRRARVKVDAEGYRARRLEKLLEKAEDAIDSVLESGESERLEPMDVFERKAVHQLVAQVEGLSSRSQGREPARRVVIERE